MTGTATAVDLVGLVSSADSDLWWARRVQEVYDIEDLEERAIQACILVDRIERMEQLIVPLRDIACLDHKNAGGVSARVAEGAGLTAPAISHAIRRARKEEATRRAAVIENRKELHRILGL